jgi:hypothetical protein
MVQGTKTTRDRLQTSHVGSTHPVVVPVACGRRQIFTLATGMTKIIRVRRHQS